ncbi:MAG TPA: lysophospholipid acyltransferase family protein [Dokdonella sp.]|uniref:lysophospholipid acyltransferase family protein n=1 Tax=Dokdonella sp. TaxID=2291710 RepID=UPI002D7EF4C8|nr:lysophospholipid acyltransferase family protein [Dokdonella sp.]HET9034371.1 lysophospholipid acyltransferase family protein [Dokdonella sp.]
MTSSSIRSRALSGFAWRVFNALQLLFTLVWTAVLVCLALLVLIISGDRKHWPLRMASRLWAPGLLGGAGVKLELAGFEAVDLSRPHVIVANHQSIIDICVLFRAIPLPLRFVLKQELASLPFVGAYARAMGMVFIERNSARNASRKLHDAAMIFDEGHCLCAFPEGTRSRDGRVGTFKGGVFKLAIETGIPILPVVIEGSGNVLPACGFRVRPGRIRLRAGSPVQTRGLNQADRQELANRCRRMIIEMQHR